MARRRSFGRTLLSLLILVAALAVAYWILTRGSDSSAPDAPVATEAPAGSPRAPGYAHTDGPGVDVASWNIANLGGSKNDQEVGVMADVLRSFDLVAIQEVITSPPGAQAVARLVDALERRGSDWDYVLSDPTEGDGPERYAFLWKPSRVRLQGRPWLERTLNRQLDREPYLGRFEDRSTGRTFLVVNFHAVPRSKDPEREVPYMQRIHERYPDDALLILGDFNLAEDDPAFDGLKRSGYASVVQDQRTSIRMERREDGHLASEYDNIFYEETVLRAARTGIVDFTPSFATLREARMVSDHIPVYMELAWR